jgi:hypothetical protein
MASIDLDSSSAYENEGIERKAEKAPPVATITVVGGLVVALAAQLAGVFDPVIDKISGRKPKAFTPMTSVEKAFGNPSVQSLFGKINPLGKITDFHVAKDIAIKHAQKTSTFDQAMRIAFHREKVEGEDLITCEDHLRRDLKVFIEDTLKKWERERCSVQSDLRTLTIPVDPEIIMRVIGTSVMPEVMQEKIKSRNGSDVSSGAIAQSHR